MRPRFAVMLVTGLLASATLYAENGPTEAEASMLVTGSVELNTDGSVHGYTLDKQEKLPVPVVDLIQRNVPSWKFQFVSTPESAVTQTMTMRIVAKDTDDKHMTLAISGVQFDSNSGSDELAHSITRVQPNFPAYSLKSGISGHVYVLVKVGRDGNVADIAAEQVNLRRYLPQTNMSIYRKDLADAAIRAVRQWKFSVPTQGKWAQSPYFLVRIPVDFHIANMNMDLNDGGQYGTWQVYIPGPRMDVPWLSDKRLLADAADTTADGTTHQLGVSPQLESP
jgi:hypothetical protein